MIKDAGFNAVRLPVRFSAQVLPASPYTLDEDFMRMLDGLVDEALEMGLTVVLDFHHFDEMMADPQGYREEFLAIWEQLASRYQSYPDTLLFELLNEPHANLDATFWNELLAETLPMIRATNPLRWVIIGGVDYNDVSQLALLRLPSDDHLIATFHYYEPFEFTHQGAHWVDGSETWIGTRWTGSDEEKRAVREALNLAVAFSEAQGVRMLMDEFGSGEDASLEERAAWTAFVAREAEDRGISWFYWQFCSDFGIYDCAAERFSHPLLDALFPK